MKKEKKKEDSPVYRPYINDLDRNVRNRVDVLEEKTGMKRQHLEKKIFEIGVEQMEILNP